MRDFHDRTAYEQTKTPAPARVIFQEFLKVLGRTEAEQPLICQEVCICAQFWRYQHYLLPLWDWGVTKIVCYNLGSFRDVQEDGRPFPEHNQKHTYRDAIRDRALLAACNAAELSRHDPLQSLLRHVAAIEMASMLKFCSSRRGIEHQLIKYYFKKLTAIQNLTLPAAATEEEEGEGENKGEVESGEVIMLDDRLLEKISKMPPTAGYAGDRDLVDVSVYLWDDEYTKEDRNALGLLQGAMRAAHLPPLEVVDCREVPSVWEIVDEHTLLYAVDPSSALLAGELLSGRQHAAKPAAMIWCGRTRDEESSSSSRVLAGGSGNVSPSPSPSPSGSYEEFKLDRRRAPHTVGSAHLYIRRDIVEAAERESIVPPYPVTFPHDYPYKHDNWYLDGLQRHGSGRVVKRSETDG